MSDNVDITSGAGTGIATDNVGGKHHQRVKLSLGADGTAVDAVGGSGVDSTGVQRVSLATNVALPAGTNAIGKLAANSGVDIGDVDITSIAAGTNTIGNVRSHGRTVTTRLWYHSGALVVGAAADAANVGRVYVENDPDSSVFVVITRVRFSSQLGSALATPTSPRFVLRFFTFTGNTPSGAAITGVEQDTSYSAKNGNWDVRTAATGMTITEGADVASFFTVAGATAVAYSPPSVAEWVTEPDRPLILRAGEGIMLKQADAGTASDTRRVTCDFEIEQCSAV